MIEPGAIAGGDRIHARALEQRAVQLARETSVALLAQQPGAEHVFVDLRLQLELEQRHRLVVAGVPRDIDEMAHPFGRGEVVGEIVADERANGSRCASRASTARIDEQRERQRVALLRDEQLLVAGARLAERAQVARDRS